jgi:hypothetical protein
MAKEITMNEHVDELGIPITTEEKKAEKKKFSKKLKTLGIGALCLGVGGSVYIASKINDLSNLKNVSTNIGLPTVSGYSTNDGWISPDFKINSDYDGFFNINNFAHALVEANGTRNFKFGKEKLMLPGLRFHWGRPFGTVERYKIYKFSPRDIDKVPDNAKIPGAKYYALYIDTYDKKYGEHCNGFLVALYNKRFYLAGGLGP